MTIQESLSEYTQLKKQAIIEVYEDISKVFRDRLATELRIPLEYMELIYRIRNKVTFNDNDISMLVGFINESDYRDEIGNQIHFLLNGSSPHWVSIKSHGAVRSWAVRHNIIKVGKDGKPYWVKGKHAGKPTKAILFSNIAQKSRIQQIKQEIYRELVIRLRQVTGG